jgi:hypothetical protein
MRSGYAGKIVSVWATARVDLTIGAMRGASPLEDIYRDFIGVHRVRFQNAEINLRAHFHTSLHAGYYP